MGVIWRVQGEGGGGAYLVQLHHVKDLGCDLVAAVFLDELIQVLLSSAGNDKLGAVLDHLGGERLADAGGGTDDEDFLVGKRHDD